MFMQSTKQTGINCLILCLCFLIVLLVQPVNAHDYEESSKDKFIGIGGWLIGNDCRNMELYWKVIDGDPDVEPRTNTYFRNPSGAVRKLPEGMAMFSPNCKYFWTRDYYARKDFKIFSAKTGRQLIEIMGEHPAWSSNGQSIYYFRTKKSKRQLWELNVKDKKKNLIIEVQDFSPCFQQGDEVEWYPVIVTKEAQIIWNYWIKGSDDTRAKKLVIDAKKKTVIKSEDKEYCPCSAFEEEN